MKIVLGSVLESAGPCYASYLVEKVFQVVENCFGEVWFEKCWIFPDSYLLGQCSRCLKSVVGSVFETFWLVFCFVSA